MPERERPSREGVDCAPCCKASAGLLLLANLTPDTSVESTYPTPTTTYAWGVHMHAESSESPASTSRHAKLAGPSKHAAEWVAVENTSKVQEKPREYEILCAGAGVTWRARTLPHDEAGRVVAARVAQAPEQRVDARRQLQARQRGLHLEHLAVRDGPAHVDRKHLCAARAPPALSTTASGCPADASPGDSLAGSAGAVSGDCVHTLGR